ncbi:hypothetical protein V1477_003287 [Vespula maculifrons]|uniref:Uncharacterized protein n=1 Tax=Vespula maculifrons TaxID=7453 RepID=A0ABD2CU31_VESMC
MQYPWAPHHMTPERRNIAVDLAFVYHQTTVCCVSRINVVRSKFVEFLAKASNISRLAFLPGNPILSVGFGRLVGRSVGWLVGWLVGRSVGSFVGCCRVGAVLLFEFGYRRDPLRLLPLNYPATYSGRVQEPQKADRELSILIKQPPTYVTPLKLALVSFQNTREKDEHEDEEVEDGEEDEEVEEDEEDEEDEGSHGRN